LNSSNRADNFFPAVSDGKGLTKKEVDGMLDKLGYNKKKRLPMGDDAEKERSKAGIISHLI
jgi:hypothetical protein